MTNPILYPAPLRGGDKIAITAPSSGIAEPLLPRFKLVTEHLRAQGYEAVIGKCLRAQPKHVSAPREERAAELMRFWCDPEIKAIMPPWGGEFLVDILPLLDFEKMKAAGPKWIAGYSDISTLHFALTTKTGMATLHSATLMDLSPSQQDPLTSGVMKVMAVGAGESFSQHSSEKFQKQWVDFATDVAGPLNLTEASHPKALRASYDHGHFAGRLIGGCVDTIARLVGTPFGDLVRFKERSRDHGTIFYFENCELSPCELTRTLWNLRLAGWFDGLNGILIGRNAGPDATDPANTSYEDALHAVLGDLDIPILIDLDIGHRPPNFSLVNGALADIHWREGKLHLKQTFV